MVHYQTVNGYNDDEVISALQKEVRRGNHENAMYWALELAETDRVFPILVSRLKVILYEDIGLGDPDVVLQVSRAIDDMVDMFKGKKGDWKMVLSYIILSMCRAKKSRITDHFKKYMESFRDSNRIEIPDYAVDMHTSRGNLMGRTKGSLEGINHFIKEGEKLENENLTVDDIYRDKVHEMWKKKVER